MPELPDITLYIRALQPRILGATLSAIRVKSIFLLRSVDPPTDEFEGKPVTCVERLGKRIVLGFQDDIFLVLHLMIAGRLHWKPPATRPRTKVDLATFDFSSPQHAGTLLLTEAGTKHRAMLHAVRGRESLMAHDPGGIDPLTCTLTQFRAVAQRANHTLKRILSDPRTFSGIGNAYSDEILHAAALSPLALSQRLDQDQLSRLHAATRGTLNRWTATLLREFGIDPPVPGPDGLPGRFPGVGDVTAFRPDFAVHGKFGKPCPTCGDKVERIVYKDRETNYCPTCQTGGKVLADRSLSRLFGDDWPPQDD